MNTTLNPIRSLAPGSGCVDFDVPQTSKKVNVQIRQATPEDAQALKNLDTVIAIDSSRVECIDLWLKQDHVLVAEMADQVVGYGVFNHAFLRRPHVEMIMIHSDFRGQRIGELLLRELECLCDGIRLFATTNKSNHRMLCLLRRLGYRPGGYIHELDPGDPELVFVKDIGIAQQAAPPNGG